MLTFIEKLNVQKELIQKVASLSSDLTFIEKLTTQKDIVELLNKLEVKVTPTPTPTPAPVADTDKKPVTSAKKEPTPEQDPQPQPTSNIDKLITKAPNKNVQLGIDGVNGVHHKIDQDDPEFIHDMVVYSNTSNGIVCSFPLGLFYKNGSVNYEDAIISNEPKFGSYNLGGAIKHRKEKKSAYDYVVSKDSIDRAIKIAKLSAEFANKVFPLEYKNVTIEPSSDIKSGLFVSEPDKATAFYSHSLAHCIKDVDNGLVAQLIDERTTTRNAELDQIHKESIAKVRQGNTSTGTVTDKQFKIIDTYYDNDLIKNKKTGDYEYNNQLAHDIIDTVSNFNDKRLKMTDSQIKTARSIIPNLRDHISSNSRQNFESELTKNEALTSSSPTELTKQTDSNDGDETQLDQTSTDQYLEKYRAGGFNDESAPDFKKAMFTVNNAGMSVNEIGTGLEKWLIANEDQVTA